MLRTLSLTVTLKVLLADCKSRLTDSVDMILEKRNKTFIQPLLLQANFVTYFWTVTAIANPKSMVLTGALNVPRLLNSMAWQEIAHSNHQDFNIQKKYLLLNPLSPLEFDTEKMEHFNPFKLPIHISPIQE